MDGDDDVLSVIYFPSQLLRDIFRVFLQQQVANGAAAKSREGIFRGYLWR